MPASLVELRSACTAAWRGEPGAHEHAMSVARRLAEVAASHELFEVSRAARSVEWRLRACLGRNLSDVRELLSDLAETIETERAMLHCRPVVMPAANANDADFSQDEAASVICERAPERDNAPGPVVVHSATEVPERLDGGVWLDLADLAKADELYVTLSSHGLEVGLDVTELDDEAHGLAIICDVDRLEKHRGLGITLIALVESDNLSVRRAALRAGASYVLPSSGVEPGLCELLEYVRATSEPVVPRVLLLDSDRRRARTLCLRLGQLGIDASPAFELESLLEQCESEPPDFVLAGDSFRDCSGLEILTLLRSDPRTLASQFILLSTTSTQRLRSRALAAGAVDAIAYPKPGTDAEALLVARLRFPYAASPALV